MRKSKYPKHDIRRYLRKHPLCTFDDSIMSEIEHRIAGTLFACRAMISARIQILAAPHWFDPKETRRGNKDRYKEQGGVDFQFKRFISEMTISSLANAIEATETSIRNVSGVKFDIWKPGKFRSGQMMTARKVLCLNNVIKHNQGILSSRTSKHAKFLVAECKMLDGYELYLFDYDFEAMIRSIFVYLHDRGSSTSAAPRTPRWAVDSLYRKILPGFIPLCATLPRRKKEMPNHRASAGARLEETGSARR